MLICHKAVHSSTRGKCREKTGRKGTLLVFAQHYAPLQKNRSRDMCAYVENVTPILAL